MVSLYPCLCLNEYLHVWELRCCVMLCTADTEDRRHLCPLQRLHSFLPESWPVEYHCILPSNCTVNSLRCTCKVAPGDGSLSSLPQGHHITCWGGGGGDWAGSSLRYLGWLREIELSLPLFYHCYNEYSGTSECGHTLGPIILSFVERLSSFRGCFVQSLYTTALCFEVCPLSECPLSEVLL